MNIEQKKQILEKLKEKNRIFIPDFESLEEELELSLENEILGKKIALQRLLEEKEQLKTILYNLSIA